MKEVKNMKMLLAIMVLALGLMGCGQSSDSVKGPVVYSAVIYGDSIAKGYVPNSFFAQYAAHLSLVPTNQAVGSTAMDYDNQYAKMMSDDLTGMQAVFLHTGVNDAAYHGHDPEYLAYYRKAMRSVLRRWVAFGVNAYIATPCTIAAGTVTTVKNEDIGLYAQIMREEVANVNSPKIHLSDFNATWVPTAQNTLDGLHPNEQGNNTLYKIMLNN